jgi:hypothetical protein
MLDLEAWAKPSASAHRHLGGPVPLRRTAWALGPRRSPLGPASPDASGTLSRNNTLGMDRSDTDDLAGRVPSDGPSGAA